MAARRALARFFSGILAAVTTAFCFVASGCHVQNVYGPPPVEPDVNEIQDVYGPPPTDWDDSASEAFDGDEGSPTA